jgi:hypothetical protein
MEPPATDKMPLRLLLNAEPFGFGPTAAIAGFFPHLREHFEKIGFAGKRHALDLQRGLPYDAIHDVTDGKEAEVMAPVFAQYDILLTAMDDKVAALAKDAGLKVFYYDALAWYWPEIPESAKNTDLYLAQDFFGVKERLTEAFNGAAAESHIVSPIAPQAPLSQEKTHVLINLGGLQNPFTPVADVVAYARAVIASLRNAIPATENIVIAGSQAVADQLQDEGVKTFPREDMMEVLAGAKLAFMTPGLGNIYDAATFNIPTVWLPPANDSQGRQLELLKKHGMLDAAMDWQDVSGGAIDYAAEQSSVLTKIAEVSRALSADKDMQARLTTLADAHYTALQGQTDSKAAQLIKRFGIGGEEQVVAHVVRKARQYLAPGDKGG